MADENSQAKADDIDTQPTVADPLDPANSTNSGDENPLSQFEEEIANLEANGFQAASRKEEEQQEESADESDFEDEENADPDEQEEEQEEDSEESDNDEDEEDSPEPKTQERFRFKSDEDKAVAAIAKARGVSLVEAAQIYSGTAPAKAEDSPEPSKNADPVPKAAELEARIEALEEEELEAIRLVDVDRQVEIKQELRALNKQVIEAKAAESAAKQSEAQRLDSEFEASCNKAYAAYPDLKDPNSVLFKRVAQMDQAAKANGDPLFNSPSKLWDFGRRAAKELGVPMASTVKPSKDQAPMKKGKVTTSMKPASGNSRATSATPSQKVQQEIDGLDSVDAFEQYVGAFAD